MKFKHYWEKSSDYIAMKILLLIVLGVSVYFATQGYKFLKNIWDWKDTALPTVILVETIYIFALMAGYRSKTNRAVAFVVAFFALSASAALPIFSAYDTYEKAKRVVIVATREIPIPIYFKDTVINDMQSELDELEAIVGPKKKEKVRRMNIGNGVYEKRNNKDGTIRIITGFEAANWIPWRSDKKDFNRVKFLKDDIRAKKESDVAELNKYNLGAAALNFEKKSSVSDENNAFGTFIKQLLIILFFAGASLYYMYAYNNPKRTNPLVQKKPEEPKEPEIPVVATQQTFNNKEFVLLEYPDAVGKKEGGLIQIRSGGLILGSAKNAPHAWRDARVNIVNKKL
ncbi:hypothetical protein KAR91_55685 [Candidatus Pacearchaeota archaeon]|nr:hypothetical protein [Candidatus Pacearchaeota archaeon]